VSCVVGNSPRTLCDRTSSDAIARRRVLSDVVGCDRKLSDVTSVAVRRRRAFTLSNTYTISILTSNDGVRKNILITFFSRSEDALYTKIRTTIIVKGIFI